MTKVCKSCYGDFEIQEAHDLYCVKCKTKVCETCGKKYSNKNHTKSRFCSMGCRNLWAKENIVPPSRKGATGQEAWNKGISYPGIVMTCPVCENGFGMAPYRLARITGCVYCSKECRATHNISPKNKLIRRSKEFIEWRAQVFERDDYTCQICNQRGGVLHPDHIKQFAYYPELRFDVNNGRTLCAPCHMQTPTWGRKIPRLAVAEQWQTEFEA